MSDKTPSMAGGFAISVCTLVGAIVGLRAGWGSSGLLIGLGVGIVIAFVVAAIDRRR